MKRFIFLAILFLSCRAFAEPFPLDAELNGPDSIYSDKLLHLLKKWPPRDFPYAQTLREGQDPIGLRCLKTPGHRSYVGVEQWMVIRAPVSRVQAVLDDFDDYKNLFIGFDDVSVLKKDQNKFILLWKQHIPVLPDITYEMNYLKSRLPGGQIVYRYKLHYGRTLKRSDGVIVLESAGANQTRYAEYDFFEADWGLLAFSQERIWRESTEGIYLSDAVVKLKSENPGWSDAKTREEAKKLLEKFPVSPAVQDRKGIDDFKEFSGL